jgi:hypothetical protein
MEEQRGRWPMVVLTDKGRHRRGRLQIRHSLRRIPAAKWTDGDAASWIRWRRGSLWPVSRGQGESSKGARWPRCGSREGKKERKQGPAWAHHAKKKRRGVQRSASMGTDGASHTGAGEGEGEAGWWAGPWGGVQLAVGREGMTGGPDFQI